MILLLFILFNLLATNVNAQFYSGPFSDPSSTGGGGGGASDTLTVASPFTLIPVSGTESRLELDPLEPIPFEELSSAPSTPAANGLYLYAKDKTGVSTLYYKKDDGTEVELGASGVTSVALSLPAIFSVSGSPVTSSGTLTGSLATQSANLVWAGPTSGSAASPTFRRITGVDLAQSANEVTADVTINNSVAETTIATWTIPANTLSTDGGIRGTIFANVFNNSGAGRTFVLKIKVAGTTVYEDTTRSIGTGAARRVCRIEVDFFNNGATNSNETFGYYALSAAGATTGEGDISAALDNIPINGATSTADTTASVDVTVTVTLSAADVNYEFKALRSTQEYI